MDGANQTTFPVEAFQFDAPASVLPAAADGKRAFKGLAYSGEIVSDHCYWSAVIFDLATTQVAERIPVLLDHDPDKRAGVARLAIANQQITAQGDLLPNTHGQGLAADADAGFPWQLSIHIRPGRVEELSAGATTQVNGRTVTGPLHIFRDSRIREVSFTPTGADHRTSASVFSSTPKEPVMSDPTNADLQKQFDALKAQHEQAQAQITALTAERDQFKASADKAVADAAEQAKAARLTEVTALFTATGRKFSDDAAKPYLSLDQATFAAIAKNERDLAKTRHPNSLFSAHATGPEGEGDEKGEGEDQTEAHKFAARVAGHVNRPKGK